MIEPHLQIPTRDGTQLSAAVHRPDDGTGRWPVLIEYHPYRKDDRSSPRAADHAYFASNGFVSVRLDVRGTGSSQGVNTDEYMSIETQDGYDAVEWLAGQDWCNGNVGMFGSSYGGFTCYQVAMLQPPSLKAIVPIYATDDRYTDDCHYKGGQLKAYYDVGTYGTMMAAMNFLPPDQAHFGEGWRDEWEKRLAANEPYMPKWLGHQTDQQYWRQGSLRGNYQKLNAATFIIGGWQDGYPNPPLRVFENIDCPKKVLVGPWNHSRPDVAIPGPRIDYLYEMRRWFDLYLKGIDDGVSSEPPVTLFVQEYDSPDPARTDTAGEWRSEETWPPAISTAREFYLDGASNDTGQLKVSPTGSASVLELKADPTTGIQGGLWSGGLPFGLPGDQRRDEALSLSFSTLPLAEPVAFAGNPSLTLTVTSSAPSALYVAKLSDVAPDGSSALVCRGLLNGARRNGMGKPEPMEPHRPYRISIELDASAWKFEAGHRIRLSISGSDFPNSWPTADNPTIGVLTGGDNQAILNLPLLESHGMAGPSFMTAPEHEKAPSGNASQEWSIAENPLENSTTLRVSRSAETPVREGVTFVGSDDLTLSTSRTSAGETSAVGRSTSAIKTDGTEISSTATQIIKSDSTGFHWSLEVEVVENSATKLQRKWQESFPRTYM